MLDKRLLIRDLAKNWEYIQKKINQITIFENIDIKQISDLQRYIEMQKNIAITYKELSK